MIFKISLAEVEIIAHRTARELLRFDEPIPDFSSRFPNILESCLSAPFQTFNSRSLNKGLVEQGSSLFYLMIKNHPFQNGNKRIAITTLFHFLAKNGKWIKTTNEDLYVFAVWVAASPAEFQAETIAAIKKFFKKNLIDIS